MSSWQSVQPRSAPNGPGRRRGKESQHTKAESNLLTGAGGSSRDRLVYSTTCLIGHNVEVQVLDGSVFSGIFHAADAENDFGIILKMARLINDCSGRQKGISDIVIEPLTKTMIIPGNELVQIIGKDVPVLRSGLAGGELQLDKQQELLIDSSISKSRIVDSGRELERWVPDDDDPECPELENIFDGPWNRGWDQFIVNEALFGVKTTFVEELYTTRLEKGPQMKELEREAMRIAKEIEGEATYDLHLAEERGMILNENLEMDEETRFSSVFRGVDNSGNDDSDNILLDAQKDKTFEGGYSSAVDKSIGELANRRPTDGAGSSTMPYVGTEQSSQSTSGIDFHESGSDANIPQLQFGSLLPEDDMELERRFAEDTEDGHELSEGTQWSKPDVCAESQPVMRGKNERSDKIELSASKGQEKTSSKAQQVAVSHAGPSGSSASSTSEFGGVTTAIRLSPSSSVGSLSSERSSLNPNAKEFKLNPNAMVFQPSQTQSRPASPVPDGSFYYPGNVVPGPPHMPPPMGFGIGSAFGPNPQVVYNPQSGYFYPPQYAQQMMISQQQMMLSQQPRQMYYMPPTYPPDMHYRG